MNTFSPWLIIFLRSIRVSNELGAGRPQAARLATRVVMLLAFSLGVSEGLVMVLARSLLGYAYTNDEEVALYTARLMPILAACTLLDCLQCVLSGTSQVIRYTAQITVSHYIQTQVNLHIN